MIVILLHGGFVDDFLVDLVLPVIMFIGLYRWADRKSKRENAAKRDAAATPAGPAEPGEGTEQTPR